jgi:hypothetical protein
LSTPEWTVIPPLGQEFMGALFCKATLIDCGAEVSALLPPQALMIKSNDNAAIS